MPDYADEYIKSLEEKHGMGEKTPPVSTPETVPVAAETSPQAVTATPAEPPAAAGITQPPLDTAAAYIKGLEEKHGMGRPSAPITPPAAATPVIPPELSAPTSEPAPVVPPVETPAPAPVTPAPVAPPAEVSPSEQIPTFGEAAPVAPAPVPGEESWPVRAFKELGRGSAVSVKPVLETVQGFLRGLENAMAVPYRAATGDWESDTPHNLTWLTGKALEVGAPQKMIDEAHPVTKFLGNLLGGLESYMLPGKLLGAAGVVLPNASLMQKFGSNLITFGATDVYSAVGAGGSDTDVRNALLKSIPTAALFTVAQVIPFDKLTNNPWLTKALESTATGGAFVGNHLIGGGETDPAALAVSFLTGFALHAVTSGVPRPQKGFTPEQIKEFWDKHFQDYTLDWQKENGVTPEQFAAGVKPILDDIGNVPPEGGVSPAPEPPVGGPFNRAGLDTLMGVRPTAPEPPPGAASSPFPRVPGPEIPPVAEVPTEAAAAADAAGAPPSDTKPVVRPDAPMGTTQDNVAPEPKKPEPKASLPDSITGKKIIPPVEAKPEAKPAKPEPTTPAPPLTVAGDASTPVPEVPKPVRDTLKEAVDLGVRTTAQTADGQKIPVQYAIVPQESLIVSHDTTLNENPAFPQEFQPRDRTRKASIERLGNLENNYNPEFYGATPAAWDGAPIVGPDMVVESGNGRLLLNRRGVEGATPKQRENQAAYQDWLQKNAESLGIDLAKLEGVKDPILIRIRTNEIDDTARKKLVRDMNISGVETSSEMENAVADGKVLRDGDVLNLFNPDMPLNAAGNRDFRTSFINGLNPMDRNRYVSPNGDINVSGLKRIRDAVFAAAYGEGSALSKMAEETDNASKNVTTALMAVAPRLAKINQEIARGNLYDLSFSKNLADAASILTWIKENQGNVPAGMTPVDYYLSQGQLFDKPATLTVEIVKVLENYKNSAKKLGLIFNHYMDTIERAGNPKQPDLLDPDRIIPGGSPSTFLDPLTSAVNDIEALYGKGKVASDMTPTPATRPGNPPDPGLPPGTVRVEPGVLSASDKIIPGDSITMSGEVGTVLELKGDQVRVRMEGMDPKGSAWVPLDVVEMNKAYDSLAQYQKEIGDKIGEIKGKLDLNQEGVFETMGKEAYASSVSNISVKELMQNAFDAVKEYIYKNKGAKVGNIHLSIDRNERSVTIKDDGMGMTEDIVNKGLFTIGGTVKDMPAHLRSGGLGMAKMAIFTCADRVVLETTRDGRTIKLDALARDIRASNFTPEIFKAEPGAHGTTIKVFIPEKYVDSAGETKYIPFPSTINEIRPLKYPLLGPVKITAEVTEYGTRFGEVETLAKGVNHDAKAMPKITTATFSWGTADIYYGKERVDGYPSHSILSSGIFQFENNFKDKPGWSGDTIPYNIIVDIKSNVPAQHGDYPFAMNRESFKPRMNKEIDELRKYLHAIARGTEAEDIQANFKNIKSMPRINFDQRSAGEAREARAALKAGPIKATKTPPIPKKITITEDGAKTADGTFFSKSDNVKAATAKFDTKAPVMDQFMLDMDQPPSKPIFHNNTNLELVWGKTAPDIKIKGHPELFFAEIGTIITEMKEKLAESGRYDRLGGLVYSGVSIDKGYCGVAISLPYKAAFINPLNPIYKSKSVTATKDAMYSTMIHELAHVVNMVDHGEVHNNNMSQIQGWLAEKGLTEYFQNLILKSLTAHSEVVQVLKDRYDARTTRNTGKSLETGQTQQTGGPVGVGEGGGGDALRALQAGGGPGGGGPVPAGVGTGEPSPERSRTGGLSVGARPLSKFEQRLKGITSAYPDADPERVAQALRAAPKMSDREIAAQAGMAPEAAGKVQQGTTQVAMAKAGMRPGVQPGLYGESAPGGPGGLFAEPEAAPGPERSFAPTVPAGARSAEAAKPVEVQKTLKDSLSGLPAGQGNQLNDIFNKAIDIVVKGSDPKTGIKGGDYETIRQMIDRVQEVLESRGGLKPGETWKVGDAVWRELRQRYIQAHGLEGKVAARNRMDAARDPRAMLDENQVPFYDATMNSSEGLGHGLDAINDLVSSSKGAAPAIRGSYHDPDGNFVVVLKGKIPEAELKDILKQFQSPGRTNDRLGSNSSGFNPAYQSEGKSYGLPGTPVWGDTVLRLSHYNGEFQYGRKDFTPQKPVTLDEFKQVLEKAYGKQEAANVQKPSAVPSGVADFMGKYGTAGGAGKPEGLLTEPVQTRDQKITEHEDIKGQTKIDGVTYSKFTDLVKAKDWEATRKELDLSSANFTRDAFDHHFNPSNLMARLVDGGMDLREAQALTKEYGEQVYKPVSEKMGGVAPGAGKATNLQAQFNEFLKEKGLTFNESKALPPAEKTAFQAEFGEWQKANAATKGEIPTAITGKPPEVLEVDPAKLDLNRTLKGKRPLNSVVGVDDKGNYVFAWRQSGNVMQGRLPAWIVEVDGQPGLKRRITNEAKAREYAASLVDVNESIGEEIIDRTAVRPKDEFRHLKTAEEGTAKVGDRTLKQEALFNKPAEGEAQPAEENLIMRQTPPEEAPPVVAETQQGQLIPGEPKSFKEFEADLAKDDNAREKELRNPANSLIPLYEGETYLGTRHGDFIYDANGEKVKLTKQDMYERLYDPKKPTLPLGTETTKPEKLLGTPEKPGLPGTVEAPPGYVAGVVRSVREKFSAANISEKARLAHQFVVEHLGWAAREVKKDAAILDKYSDRFGAMTQADLIKFTDAAEQGRLDQVAPDLQEAAGAWRRISDGLHSLLVDAKGGESAYWENYFPRLFENPEQAAIAISAMLKSRGTSLTGPESMNKARTQLLFSDSIKPVEEGGLGLTPRYPNYVDMMKGNIYETVRFLTGKYIESDLKDSGFITKSKTPGWEDLGKLGDKTLDGYYAHPDVARVMENFLSKGLRGDPLFELYNSPASFMNTVMVGMSAFHATFSTFSDLAHGIGSNLSRAIGAAVTGRFGLSGHYLAEMAKASNIPANVMRGGKLGEEYTTPGSHPEMSAIVDLMTKAGIRFDSPGFKETLKAIFTPGGTSQTEMGQMSKTFAEVAAQQIGIPRKVMETIAWPIMSYLVPRLKINATARLLQMELDTLTRDGKMKDMKPEDITRLAQEVSRKSDNIFGQMVYDNLSMSRGMRDGMRTLVGFPGWNIGSFTDILQASKGIGQVGYQSGKAIWDIAHGQTPTWKNLSRSNRMSMEFYMGTVMVMAVFGAITQRLLTGEWPGNAKDLFMPQTGELMSNGQPERLRAPTYMRDVLSLNHPFEMAKHKLNWPLRMMSNLVSNQDFFGTQIRDPYAGAGEQAGQVGKFVGKSLLPFGIQGYLATEAPKARALNLVGITKVPRLYSNSDAMNVIDEYNTQNRATMTSREAEAEKNLKGDLRKLAGAQDEDGFKTAAQAAMEAGTLTRQQIKSIVAESQAPPGLGRFIALPVEWQVRAWAKATDAEKAAWQPYFIKKVMSAKPEILIRNRDILDPTLREMGLDDAADAIQNLKISDKASTFKLAGLGVRQPAGEMGDIDTVDLAAAHQIAAQEARLGKEKKATAKRPSKYAFLGIQ